MSYTVYVAGTFNVLTEGHKKLLKLAVEEMEGFRRLRVYITKGDWMNKSVPVRNWAWRADDVDRFLKDECGLDPYRFCISPLEGDSVDNHVFDRCDATDTLVCSSETRANAEKLLPDREDSIKLAVLERDPAMPSATETIRKSMNRERIRVIRW